MTEEEKQIGLELQAYADSLKDMTLKEIAIQHLKKYRLPKFLAGLLVKFLYSLLLAKDYKLSELEKENAELKSENQKWKDGIALKDEEIGCIETDFNTFKSKAKVALRNVIDYLGQFCSDYPDCVIEAEQFINDFKQEE